LVLWLAGEFGETPKWIGLRALRRGRKAQ
jgi:hypothetical protein